MKQYHTIVTCEHAVNTVPEAYLHLFKGHEDVLKTHLAYDPGAFEMSHSISDALRAKLFLGDVSRLLVECNRSLDNDQLFSSFTKGLKGNVKETLIKQYYEPYRLRVERYISKYQPKHKLLHLSIHSFTPVLNNIERKVDIGILCDESRRDELDFSLALKELLAQQLPDHVIMLNVPYQGTDDGFTTYLRKKHTHKYLGIELEINQKFHFNDAKDTITTALIKAIKILTEKPLENALIE